MSTMSVESECATRRETVVEGECASPGDISVTGDRLEEVEALSTLELWCRRGGVGEK